MKKIHLDLTIEETNLVLEALGQMPFARVYNLIGQIQESAKAQLEHPPKNGTTHREASLSDG